MRKLHSPVFTYVIHLKSGEEYKVRNVRYMRYSDVDGKEMTNKEYPIDDMEGMLRDGIVRKDNGFLNKNTYIKLRVPYEDRYFNTKDIEKVTVSEAYDDVFKNTTIDDIANRLPYDEFLQFVFDKEQELKSVITNMGR